MKLIYIGIGAAIGAILRYSFSFFNIPYNKTVYINIIGSFLMGYFTYKYKDINPNIKVFLTVGLCGGFTTFSTFSLDIVKMIELNRFFEAGIYIFLSVFLSVLALLLGMYLGG